MEIYDKLDFVFGLLCAGVLLLFAFGVIPAAWPQWALAAAFAGKYLYTSLSRRANQDARTVQTHYRETAVRLFGTYALVKVNLPYLLLLAFLSVMLVGRFAFDTVMPAGAAGAFCVLLAFSAAYSMGLNRSIKNAILSEAERPREQP